ncbi:LytR/AlgR family response regulator transcription factor [Hymenobacter chitinivorans]|uniref:DNA-binding LytR/AlgR family response regulator n=1 Tax=Hymenobacter chitinivorans DSM 11115 TaxID=1121954 RepID=A0A2M9B9R9_9BACT|nr:LytTR family DNA-binding domain-containing protein [Hymenobacter chitinivorans]PJJ54690.1 DNA-binding LytR/AlgR family response regulator [Hymenobacter chitinivorans DSM 11115]
MNILILEDEELAARQTIQFLEQAGLLTEAPPVVRSVEKALSWLQTHPMPDLLFSDIELLDGNVFSLYERFRVTCPIIFTTAYDQFLLAAFRGNGIAYLLKPYSYEQFREALDKYHFLQSSFAAPTVPAAAPEPTPAALSPEVLRELSQALRHNAQPQFKQRFSVRMRNGLYILQVDDVAYVQADEGVTFAVDGAGTRYPLGGTLSELERQLDPARFGRLNRSELVNIAFIEKVEPYFNSRLAVKLRGSSAALITSAAQTPEFRKWLEG